MKTQTFTEYLEEQCAEELDGVLDDELEESVLEYIAGLDVQEVID